MNSAVAPDPTDKPDSRFTAVLIEKLQVAGHDVCQDRSGGFLVSRWGMTRHCIDTESLFAFARQVGAKP